MEELRPCEITELLHRLHDVIYVLSEQGVILYINHAVTKYGYDPVALVGKNFSNFVSEEDIEKVSHSFYQTLSEETNQPIIFRIIDSNGNYRQVEEWGRAIKRAHGQSVVIGILRDITRRLTPSELVNMNDPFMSIVKVSKDAIIAINENGFITIFNRAAEQMFGWQATEMIGQPLTRIIPPKYKKRHQGYIARFFSRASGELAIKSSIELPAEKSDGTIFQVELTLSQGQLGGKRFVFAIIRDISERKQYEKIIAKQAITDDLTELLNRRGFFDLAAKQLAEAGKNKRKLLMLYIDIDNLKPTNDEYGHYAGDCLLKTMAKILRDSFRENDVLARMGGDEFVILLKSIDQEIVISRIMSNIAAANKKIKIPISVSIGTAIFDPHKPISIDEMLTIADRNMYKHKRRKSL